MPSAEHRPGRCEVITSARLAGEQGRQRPGGRRRRQPHRARLPRGPGRAGAALYEGPGRLRRQAVTALIEMEAVWLLPPELVAVRPD
jgi:hypothetical protein